MDTKVTKESHPTLYAALRIVETQSGMAGWSGYSFNDEYLLPGSTDQYQRVEQELSQIPSDELESFVLDESVTERLNDEYDLMLTNEVLNAFFDKALPVLWGGDEHRYDLDTDRCVCGGCVVYFDEDDDGKPGEGCEVSGRVWAVPRKEKPRRKPTPPLYD